LNTSHLQVPAEGIRARFSTAKGTVDAPDESPSIPEVLRSNHRRDGIASARQRSFVADPKVHSHITVGPEEGLGILTQECPIEGRHRSNGLCPGQCNPDLLGCTRGLEVHAIVAIGERHLAASLGAEGGQPVMGDLGNLTRDGIPGFRKTIFISPVPPDRQEARRYLPKLGLLSAIDTRQCPWHRLRLFTKSQQEFPGGAWKDRSTGRDGPRVGEASQDPPRSTVEPGQGSGWIHLQGKAPEGPAPRAVGIDPSGAWKTGWVIISV
jgi:hypothetical protein